MSIDADPNNVGASSILTFGVDGTERMRIDSGGNVGVGTTPTSRLHVAGDANAGVEIAVQNGNVGSSATARMLLLADAGYGTVGATSAAYADIAGAADSLLFSTANLSGGIQFAQAGVTQVKIDSTGQLTVNAPAGLGYGTGAGGTVTQATSRVTGVTLNKPTGAITLFTAAGSATAATFTVTNTLVAATDTVVLSVKSGTNVYLTAVTAVAASSFNITFWTTGGTASDAPVINFAIIKGAAA
jgi:hypothetical protein